MHCCYIFVSGFGYFDAGLGSLPELICHFRACLESRRSHAHVLKAKSRGTVGQSALTKPIHRFQAVHQLLELPYGTYSHTSNYVEDLPRGSIVTKITFRLVAVTNHPFAY